MQPQHALALLEILTLLGDGVEAQAQQRRQRIPGRHRSVGDRDQPDVSAVGRDVPPGERRRPDRTGGAAGVRRAVLRSLPKWHGRQLPAAADAVPDVNFAPGAATCAVEPSEHARPVLGRPQESLVSLS